MSIYTRGAALAQRQLAAKGQRGAVRRVVVDGGRPSYPTLGTSAETDYPCNLAVFPVNQRDIDGTTIKAGDFNVLVDNSELSVTPTTTDKLVTTQGILTIVDAGRFDPAGVVTHYKMQARL